MAASENFTKDHELLIRIDERLIAIIERISAIESSIQQKQSQAELYKTRVDLIYSEVYGTKNTEGLIKKVEKHDKLLTKAMACFALITAGINYLFNYFFGN